MCAIEIPIQIWISHLSSFHWNTHFIGISIRFGLCVCFFQYLLAHWQRQIHIYTRSYSVWLSFVVRVYVQCTVFRFSGRKTPKGITFKAAGFLFSHQNGIYPQNMIMCISNPLQFNCIHLDWCLSKSKNLCADKYKSAASTFQNAIFWCGYIWFDMYKIHIFETLEWKYVRRYLSFHLFLFFIL